MLFKLALSALTAVAMGLIATAALADSVDFANPAFAQVSGPTSIPIGASEFCKEHTGECAPAGRVVDAVSLDEVLWRQLLAINARVNSSVAPATDEDLYDMAERWAYPTGAGDCEDYALLKRKQLIAAGWSPSTLLMTVVRQPNGDGHAVLMVRTDRGDLVLDNQDGVVRIWTESPYHFLKRQSQGNPGEWVDILDDRWTLVAAAH
jgi:predicted transglutaminase-like cysteine proteinase